MDVIHWAIVVVSHGEHRGILSKQASLTQAREEPEQFYAAQLITSAAPSSFCSHRCACLHRRTTHHQFEIRIDSTCKLVCNVLLEQ